MLTYCAVELGINRLNVFANIAWKMKQRNWQWNLELQVELTGGSQTISEIVLELSISGSFSKYVAYE